MTEIRAKSMLRRHFGTDAWFVGGCGMNLYRGCAHDCAYCDGRAEKYRVEGDFAAEIGVKSNAPEILRRELPERGGGADELFPDSGAPRKRGDKSVNGFVLMGGGVGDSYQQAEASSGLARRVLELLEERGLPVHVLTKSTLVLRDADILRRINEKARAVVSFSISTVDDATASVFEPGAAPPSERLKALADLRSRGIHGGVFLLPVIPCVSDSAEDIDRAVRAARRAGAEFTAFGGMTMKEGRQSDHFFSVLGAYKPEAVEPCRALYARRSKYGEADGAYYAELAARFAAASRRHGMPPRMPRPVFAGLLRGLDLAMVLMEHTHAMLEIEGRTSSYRKVAACMYRAGAVTRETVSTVPGIGKKAAEMIEEIWDTGTSALYEELLARRSKPEPPQGDA